MEIAVELRNPIDNFLYALRAPETKRKYPQRLKFFFDFVYPDLAKSNIVTQSLEFIKDAKGETNLFLTVFLDSY